MLYSVTLTDQHQPPIVARDSGLSEDVLDALATVAISVAPLRHDGTRDYLRELLETRETVDTILGAERVASEAAWHAPDAYGVATFDTGAYRLQVEAMREHDEY